MKKSDQADEERIPVSEGLIDGPIDYDRLKREIYENGPIRERHPQSGLETYLNISPCVCGWEDCVEDVISVRIRHGVVGFQTTIDEEMLLSHDSVRAMMHAFFHYPEAFYSSSSDEQLIELEIREKLNIEPFEIYTSEDFSETLSDKLAETDFSEVSFWEAHNLLPLLRILAIKRQWKVWASEEPEASEQEDDLSYDELISEVFDLAFLAGRLWSEYRTKKNLEDLVDKGEASVRAQERRTEGSGKVAAEKKLQNIECFMSEIEKLAAHFPAISEAAILDQAYRNSQSLRQMPTSRKTRDSYETFLRSDRKFKVRYFSVFGNA